jgi:hypothetical protein
MTVALRGRRNDYEPSRSQTATGIPQDEGAVKREAKGREAASRR